MAKTLKRLVAKPVHRMVKHRQAPAQKRAPRKKEKPMVKQTDEAVEKQLVTDPQTGEPAKPLYGNENYVSDHRPRARSENPPTAAEWLAEAKEAEAVLTRGDHVSPELVERLFLDAVPVIENAAGGTTEPTSKKREREEK